MVTQWLRYDASHEGGCCRVPCARFADVRRRIVGDALMEQATLFALTERERILAHYEQDHQSYIRTLRAHAVDFAKKNGRVTIDVLRWEMARLAIPMPDEIGVTERIFGRVLAGCKELRVIGTEVSRRKERVARAGIGGSMICIYGPAA